MEEKTHLEKLTKIEGQNDAISNNHLFNLFKDYNIIKQLPTSGAEADNFLIKKNEQLYFLKLYRKGITPNIEVLNKIKKITQKLKKNVVEIYEIGFEQKTERYFEILEYIQNGDLKQLIKETLKYSPQEKEKFIDTVIEKIAEGLKCLHENGIVHRDLKPTNILIRCKDPLEIVHIDFGISKTIDQDISKVATTHFKGTIYYIAPEEISNYFGKEIDWWHLGIMIYEFLAGKNPFAGMSEATVIHLLTTKGIEIPSNFPEKYQLLLKGLLTRDYEKRWGYKQIQEWLKGNKKIPVFYEEAKIHQNEEEKNWEKFGIPKESIWRKLGLEPEKTITFKEAGFGFNEAKDWIEAGWTNGELARIWFEDGFEPQEAMIYENFGLSKSQAKILKAHGITAYDLDQIKYKIEDLDQFINKLMESIKQGRDPKKVIRLQKILWKDVKTNQQENISKDKAKLLIDLIKNKDTKINNIKWKNIENNNK